MKDFIETVLGICAVAVMIPLLLLMQAAPLIVAILVVVWIFN